MRASERKSRQFGAFTVPDMQEEDRNEEENTDRRPTKKQYCC